MYVSCTLAKPSGFLFPLRSAGLNAWIGSLLDGLTLDPILICFLATVVMVSVTQVVGVQDRMIRNSIQIMYPEALRLSPLGQQYFSSP